MSPGESGFRNQTYCCWLIEFTLNTLCKWLIGCVDHVYLQSDVTFRVILLGFEG